MRLKRLEVQGFKTFAVRTEFLFNSGVTAIVGPNGSGKSNLADAIRWALGEQSYATLRARRTEDMIFSGSQQRARQGMAQVTLVLDNTTGWLPIDFTEVSITRRAYRSGENEYLLNGNRVRLRDIQDLLGASGLARRTYAVIGQGLVDQALALRPEERRTLFEEAAGIATHQAKRDEALRRLDETQANLVRVKDILAEMEPRLRYLERQARRAEERQQIARDLEDALKIWYGYLWQRALRRITAAQATAQQAQEALTRRKAALEQLEARIHELRQAQTRLRESLSQWHRESSQIHRQAEQVQRRLAVSSERHRMLGLQADELRQELDGARARLTAQQERVREAEAALSAVEDRLREARAEAERAQRVADEAAARRSRVQAELETARRSLVRAESSEEEAKRRIQSLRDELDAGEAATAEHEARARDALERARALEQEARALAEMLQQAEEGAIQTRQQLQEARSAVEQARREERAAAERLQEARRQVDQLQARLDALERLHEEGAGMFAGVRAVVQAARAARPELRGILGTVGELIDVPPELEVAIETALGGRLQDVVVERWQDAEAAIAYLKRRQAGRATFLPLDHLSPPEPISAPRMDGVLGVASDLVSAEPRLRDVVHMTLGRLVVVTDLAVARRAFDAMGGRVQVVTLEGDIVRPGGSVTGGSRDTRHTSGILARERERRELPGRIRAATRAAAEAEAALQKAAEGVSQAEAEVSRLEEALRLQGEQRTELQRQLQEKRSQVAGARQEAEWLRSLAEQARERFEAGQQQLAALEAAVAQAREEQQRWQARISELVKDLETLDGDQAVARAAEARTQAAAIEAEYRSQQTLLRRAREVLEDIARDAEARRERLTQLEAEREAIARDLEALRAEVDVLQGEIDRLAGQIGPAEAEADRLAAEQARLEEHEFSVRRQLHHEEEIAREAQLAFERAHDELERLRREIDHELGLVMLEPPEGEAEQTPLPLHPLVESLPVVEVPPDGIEQEVKRLRTQLARLGNVNPEAPKEYEEALERYEFLSEQLADLNDAVAELQQVVADLDAIMERDFLRTFKEVDERFREYFKRLFGGGSARLVLTDPDNVNSTGVEIMVSLPGKRAQSLSLLSGGERSLTAAALIFALLDVNPPPFCVLDEVDAALDEANVGRFRETLRELSERTQFIIITHNRGTVEIADTLYGITMGGDGVSRVLSLSMKDVPEVV